VLNDRLWNCSGTNERNVGTKLRILLVGMADSIHLARWVAQFDNSPFIFEIVSSSPHKRVAKGLSQRINSTSAVSMSWISRYLSVPMWWADRFVSDWLRGVLIAFRVLRFRPDVVHVHELQNAGYATRRAYQLLKGVRPKLLLTNYGSDIYWFSRVPKHLKRIKALLEIADGYSAECKRDYELAASISSGFQVMPLMPTAGGLQVTPLNTKSRFKIAVKGYENFWGKALVVLDALSGISDDLQDYEIVFFGSDKALIEKVNASYKTSNLRITAIASGGLRHDMVLKLLSESEIYIGHSLSDGISTSMLEAMAMGAIPIQTCTSCADEWITNAETGFIVPTNDVLALRSAVLEIVKGGFDSTQARLKNFNVIEKRYDANKLKSTAFSYYETLSYRKGVERPSTK
jgi:glycosyltransferase involved in cell wall biosynthesis